MKKKLLFLIPIFLLMLIFTGSPVLSYADSGDFESDNGGFNSPSEIIAYGNYLLVCDEGNSKVRIIDQESLKAYSFGKSGMQDPSTTTPTHIVCDNDYIYISIGNSNYIKKFDYKGEYQDFYHDSYMIETGEVTFNKISSLNIDTYGNLYALHIGKDSQDSRILKYSDNYFRPIEIDGLTIDDNASLLMSASSDYIFVVSSNKITAVDSRTYEIKNEYTISNEYTDVKIDYLDNIYMLNGNTITKLLASDYTTSETISLDKDYTLFAFNQVNGEVFFIDDENNCVVKSELTSVDHLSTFVKPTDYLDTTTLNTEKVKIATVTSSAIAYDYPYTLSSSTSLKAGDFVIVLSEHATGNSNFYYCLITNKKDYNMAVYIHKSHLTLIDDTITNLDDTNLLFSSSISAPSANIYKYPTSLLANEGASSSIVYSLSGLNAGDKVTAVRYLKPYKDYKGYSFYEIEFADGSYGYVNANSVVNYNTNKEPTKIKANATIKTNGDKDFVNLYAKTSTGYKLITDFVLLDGTRVRLVSNYNKEAEYTEIKYVNNGEVKTAYVKTQYVEVDGISFEIIIAILLTVICVIFTLILIAVIRKNKKVTR